MSSVVLSPISFAVYLNTSFLNDGSSVAPDISKFDSPISVSLFVVSFVVSFSAVVFVSCSSSWACFVMFSVYVFCVAPSSAVTTTLNVFAPSFSVCVPVPVIVCALCPFVAYISILDTVLGTVTSYEVLFGENPEKSFGLIPKFDSVATFDFAAAAGFVVCVGVDVAVVPRLWCFSCCCVCLLCVCF